MTTAHRVPGPDLLVAGRYRLHSRIGDGGMGSVWLAKDQLLHRDVACKRIISLDGLSEESADLIRSKALREGRIAARLSHDNAVAVHDVVIDYGTPWLVMEYAPSRSVAQILHTVGTLSFIDAAQIGAQLAAAMTQAHAAGIVHRDIKPGNILITGKGPDAGHVKLTDFGIAYLKHEETELDDDLVSGTPAYFAPEVARGSAPGDASDVYSLGATIYTMVEGEPPFGVSDDVPALLDRVARAQIRPPQKAGPLEPILLAMLTPGPSKRPTMAQVRDQLAGLVATYNHTTPAQVLEGRIRRADGAVPVWALTTPQAPRLSTGSYARSSLPAPPPPPRAMPMAYPPRAATSRPPAWQRRFLAHRTLVMSAVSAAVLVVVLILIMAL
ncbi:MAG TPA: serine/threonine-protein kinase [Gordonia sp. (in: high G+C Gram-positive bacteria)]|uniref:serine/threonine-protein kinase n=1 Tax=unclassified Gordonia (in: high G+C Gram-positive bacteria) TaxID=2657482 RepID=UPI000FB44DEB|nr:MULTISPECIES: serine/threonine-protein kinase [unclassified Gordonia (in: high G+C Gram-positive bacteria)]RUP37756.1 MAG: serine/threonine protein kinase [Gordonia sp. (in: high G+C Gram-positive bacteria)]HNP55399.1 serine/threonine-protein kinase [Gordonia sp. (in: high G+C Gram-positive bacteria)]HRC51557.1 serine/threonine-protein kinase [Gordonia sp. (in: high G+C Gram-positive bacteria)]